MPRYMIERTFPTGLIVPMDDNGRTAMRRVVDVNAQAGVTWVQSFVTEDKTKTFCVYEGPSEAAVRKAAELNKLPVDSIMEVPVTLLPK